MACTWPTPFDVPNGVLWPISGEALYHNASSSVALLCGVREAYIIRAVQVMQNKAARCITKKSWYTPTSTLLRECNWLSINQLIFYHTVLQVWKVRRTKLPVYISSRMEVSITRSALEGTLRVPSVESDLAQKSFMTRSAVMWNTIPAELRSIKKLESFKIRLKQWTKGNIGID